MEIIDTFYPDDDDDSVIFFSCNSQFFSVIIVSGFVCIVLYGTFQFSSVQYENL